MAIFSKNVILRDWNNSIRLPLDKGLEAIHRKQENNEDYLTLTGTKAQINTYLQNAPILSEHLRTLNNLPKWRMFSNEKIRIQ